MSDPATAAPERPRGRRGPQTALTLIGALAATLGVVAFLILIVVRPDGTGPARADWHDAAAGVEAEYGPATLDPQLPEGWTANFAELRTMADVPTWAIGLLSPTQGYVELDQGFAPLGNASGPAPGDAWLQAALDGRTATDYVAIDGVSWQIVDRRAEQDPGNHAYSMFTNLDSTLVVLHGTADDVDFETVATAIAAELRQR